MQSLLVVATIAIALLAPGACLLAAIGPRRLLPSAWLGAPVAAILSLLLLSVALAATFLLRGSLLDTVIALAVVSALCLLRSASRIRAERWERLRRRRPRPPRQRIDAAGAAVLAAVIAAAYVGWVVEGALFSDALYHVGQAVKLAELDRIGWSNTLQFEHGSAHPGYLLPTFQALLALPSMLHDPLRVALLLPIVTVPLGALAAAGMGHAVAGTRRAGAVAAWAWIAIPLLGAAPIFRPATLATYGGVFVLQVIIPVLVALVVAAFTRPNRWLLALVAGSTILVGILHVSYLAHLAIPMVALALGWAWTRPGYEDTRRTAVALGVVLVASIAIAGALAPKLMELQTFLQDSSAVQLPGDGEIQRANADEVRMLLVGDNSGFRLRADVVASAGGVAIVGMLLAIIGGLAQWRRPLGWLTLGGTALVLVAVLWEPAFTRIAAVMGVDQARRLGEALPLVLGVVAAAEMAASLLTRWPVASVRWRATIAVATIAASTLIGIAVIHVPRLSERGAEPVIEEWPVQAIAVVAAAAVLVLLALSVVRVARAQVAQRRRPDASAANAPVDLSPPDSPARLLGAVPRLLVVLPIVVLAATAVVAAQDGLQQRRDMHELGTTRAELSWVGAAERRALRAIPTGSVVLTDVKRRSSFRVMAIAPVYVVGAPPGHVANTERNAIAKRVQRVNRLLEGDLEPERRRRFLEVWNVDAVVLRHEPRYAEDLAAMRGPLRDEWREVSRTSELSVFERKA